MRLGDRRHPQPGQNQQHDFAGNNTVARDAAGIAKRGNHQHSLPGIPLQLAGKIKGSRFTIRGRPSTVQRTSGRLWAIVGWSRLSAAVVQHVAATRRLGRSARNVPHRLYSSLREGSRNAQEASSLDQRRAHRDQCRIDSGWRHRIDGGKAMMSEKTADGDVTQQFLDRAKALAELPEVFRCQQVAQLICETIACGVRAEAGIFEAAYGDPSGRKYWEAHLSEPMRIYSLAHVLSGHLTLKPEQVEYARVAILQAFRDAAKWANAGSLEVYLHYWHLTKITRNSRTCSISKFVRLRRSNGCSASLNAGISFPTRYETI